MFEQITEKLFRRSTVSLQAKTLARNSLQAVKPKTQKAVLHWLDQVHEIKNNSELNLTEKKKKLHKLENSEVVAKFVRTLINQAADTLPGKSHGLEKFGKAGKKIASTTLSLTRFALPSFVMSDRFEEFAAFLRSSFQAETFADHHIPAPKEDHLKETLDTHRQQQSVKTKAKQKPTVRHEKAHRTQATRGH